MYIYTWHLSIYGPSILLQVGEQLVQTAHNILEVDEDKIKQAQNISSASSR